MTAEPKINLSPKGWDEIKTTTCYMCACRCGIRVHLKDGKVTYIDGNADHPVNKGIICGKGAAGIKQHYSPARLSKPLLRVGERGSGEFREIEWDDALTMATQWLSDVRNSDPKKLAFFTGRDQSQGLTGWWASQFGTPNYAAHGGFCSVNMAAAGLYTYGGAFWEFGEPDWKHTKYFLLFGVAEDHGSNPIKAGLGKLKARGAKIVSINPVKTGYSAIADEWIGITPGTDGLFVGALIHCLLAAQKIDAEYLSRYTNASWLVIENPGGADDGLILRNPAGTPLVWDKQGSGTKAGPFGATPALLGRFNLPDGRKVVTSFTLIAERFAGDEYSPERVAEKCGVPPETTRRIAAELAHTAFNETIELDIPWTDYLGRRHEKTLGRPVSMHAMRGISAHSNGFHTCRSIHVLQIMLGTIDVPGGSRYKPPFPKSIPPHVKPAGKPGQVQPGKPLPGPPLGFVSGPEDLLVDSVGTPQRIDKAYSWDAPLAAHGLMHMVINNASKGDPYTIDVLFMYMANMSWNSAMNVPDTLKALTAKKPDGSYVIPKIIYSDAYASETVQYADLVLPDTTYLERWDCISMLDRPISEADGPADSIRQPVVEPDRDVRPFQTVLLDLGHRLGLPAMTNAEGGPRYPGGYPDYIVNHERAPGLGPLAGFRGKDGKAAGRGAVNPNQLQAYIDNGSHWYQELSDNMKYYRHVNWDYLDWATFFGFLPRPEPIIHQVYSETLQKFRLAAQGHGKVVVPEQHRKRIATYFDPIPFWYAPFEGEMVSDEDFPIHAITQRPMAMYHSWGSQNSWLRQILGRNWLYMHKAKAEKLGIADGDWVDVTSHHGTIKAQVKFSDGQNEHTVWTWNAIGKRKGAWALTPDSPEGEKGFLLNHLISDLLPEREGGYRYSNSDPVTGQAAWYDLKVRISKSADQKPESAPQFPVLKSTKRKRA
ncbi:molybdopterin oxidoreductase family protein [Aestuariivirga litoralis]|uniref:molybdopterin oxidoreductase family protein n=1 Tax=Aestuariivirga litoralis TaxID=2650924 RepID=UPI0018C60C2C|nr:molybdopterin oxidoreductase family protein [Aestuariivirga litoralis]MBG1232606.1 molybdopterin-dependent oxidoreductase [Aestuariivirga litoralis]